MSFWLHIIHHVMEIPEQDQKLEMEQMVAKEGYNKKNKKSNF